MTGTTPRGGLVLGVHPHAHGFGWAAFEGPLSLRDWATARARGSGSKNAECLERFDRLLDRLEPATLVLEAFEGPGARHSARAVRLCRAMAASALARGMEVATYSRADIRSCFAHLGPTDRHGVARAVATLFEALRPRLPRRKVPWNRDQQRLGVFSAAAAVLAHYQRDAQMLKSFL